MAVWADALSVLSGVVVVAGAAYALWEYSIQRWRRRRRLTGHLRAEAEKGVDRGQRTIVQLMRDLRMTEQQVMDAGFGTSRIQPVVAIDRSSGHARSIRFQYVPPPRRAWLGGRVGPAAASAGTPSAGTAAP